MPTNTDKAREVFRRLNPWMCDALDIGFPDEVEADLAQVIEDETTDALIDRIEKERRGMAEADLFYEALRAYERYLNEAIGKEAA